MRKPTEDELRLLQGDTIAFEQYCSGKGLINDKFKERYEALKIQIGEVEGVEGAGGKANRERQAVTIRPNMMGDNKKRRNVLYHEIGHFLFGFKSSSNKEQMEVCQRIVQAKAANNQLLTEDVVQYLSGIKLLEEYIVEKFAVNASHATLNENIQIDNNIMYPFSGNYIFDTTFSGGYGVFESLCDEFLGKTYDNFDDICSSCLNSNFYKGLFEKYDEVELMQVLGKFGYVYDSIMMWAKNRTIRSAPQTQEDLEDLSRMIPKIKSKTAHRTGSSAITPESISQTAIQCMQENPGVVSEGVTKSKGWFSRIFDKNKESQNR